MSLCHLSFFLLTIVLESAAAQSADLNGIVIEVRTGDSLSVRGEDEQIYPVRLAGIAAPQESERIRLESRQQLDAFVLGQRVIVDWSGHRERGIVVGRVLYRAPSGARTSDLKDPRSDVGMQMIFSGMARFDSATAGQLSTLLRDVYSGAEEHAHSFCVGLWAMPQAWLDDSCRARLQRWNQSRERR